ncbi:hypothetical protein AOLI_G00227800 [Acnodon oligacanthus]
MRRSGVMAVFQLCSLPLPKEGISVLFRISAKLPAPDLRNSPRALLKNDFFSFSLIFSVCVQSLVMQGSVVVLHTF